MTKTYIKKFDEELGVAEIVEEKQYGMPRKPLSNVPKKERIMAVVERVITNIQSDGRGRYK